MLVRPDLRRPLQTNSVPQTAPVAQKSGRARRPRGPPDSAAKDESERQVLTGLADSARQEGTAGGGQRRSKSRRVTCPPCVNGPYARKSCSPRAPLSSP